MADYLQRSVKDCVEKLDYILDKKTNWRVLNGGPALCYRAYYPSPEEAASPGFREDPKTAMLWKDPMKMPMVFKDTSLRDSWVAQRTLAIERAWKRVGGRLARMSEQEKQAARAKIIRIDH